MRRLTTVPVVLIWVTFVTSGCARERNADSTAVVGLPSPAALGSAEPNLAVGEDGGVYMSWLEPRDSGHALRLARLDDTVWSAPRTIREGRDFFVNWADFPSVEVLDGNRLAAHWLQRNGAGTYAYGVRIAFSSDGGETWSEPVTPHRDSSQTEHGFVAMWREDSRLGAVWLDGRNFAKAASDSASGNAGHGAGKNDGGHGAGSEMMLLSTSLGPDAALGGEEVLDSRTCDCCQNSAAMTAGGPIVAYRDRSPDEIRDIHVTRRVGGRWTEGSPVHRDGWRVDFCPVNGPAIAASGRRVAVAWFTAAGDSARVKVAFSDDAGAAFGAPVLVDDGNPAGRVDVALLPDGSALVTWIERTGADDAAVRARRVGGTGGARGTAVTIATSSASRASGFPRMALSGDDVIFAWTVPGERSEVRVARASIARFR